MARRDVIGWTPKEEATLRRLKGARVLEREIARQMGRTERSIKCKWNVLRHGRRGEPLALADRLPAVRRYRVPKPRQNDCDAHLARVLAASPCGFPFYTLNALYRRAA